jgi:hypothetical protein
MGKVSLLCSMLIVFSAATSPACKRSTQVADMNAALTEQGDDGSVAWDIDRDGKIRALVMSPSGEVMKSDATGTVTVKGEDGTKTVMLTQDPETGVLQGQGPKLKGEITEVNYALKVRGKDSNGLLYVPEGGTRELNESAKTSARIAIPDGKRGPHGGTIQVVGEDRVELVGDPSSKELRVYLLDDQWKQVQVDQRKVKVALVSDQPEVIILTPEPGGAYLKGKMTGEHDPVKITISLTTNGQTHVAFVGYQPGAHVVVGAHAPRLQIMVADGFRGPDVNVQVNSHAGVVVIQDNDDHHHGKVKGGKGAKVHIHVH